MAGLNISMLSGRLSSGFQGLFLQIYHCARGAKRWHVGTFWSRSWSKCSSDMLLGVGVTPNLLQEYQVVDMCRDKTCAHALKPAPENNYDRRIVRGVHIKWFSPPKIVEMEGLSGSPSALGYSAQKMAPRQKVRADTFPYRLNSILD